MTVNSTQQISIRLISNGFLIAVFREDGPPYEFFLPSKKELGEAINNFLNLNNEGEGNEQSEDVSG